MDKETTQYFQAVESAPVNIVITDIEGTVLYVNPRFTKTTGYTKNEVLGKNINIVNSGVQEELFYKNLWDTILSGKDWKGEFCNKKKDGAIYWEKASISSIKDDNNNIIRFIGFQEDITQEKEKEEKEKKDILQKLKYRSVLLNLTQLHFDSINEGIKSITEIVSVSLKVKRVSIWKFSNKKRELECLDLYTNSIHTTLDKLESDIYPSYFKALISDKIIVIENTRNNAVVCELVKNKQIPDSNASLIDLPLFIMGQLFGVISIQSTGIIRKWTTDEQNFLTGIGSIISTLFETFERIEAEKKLIIAIQEAKRANRVKSDFLANMSHEIRTPMNAILGFSQILMGRIENEEEHGYIESINSSGKHLLALINDILDLSKVEAGKTDIIYKQCNLQDLIKSLENMFLHKLKNTEVSLNINLDTEIPSTLLIDEDRLKQVLINIIGNAVKFTNTGSIKISSSFTYFDKNKESISLTIDIDDTGIGIPENEWENIFNPFDQTREGAKSEYSGTGLGLAISKKLINLMGGDIYIVGKSTPGTLFRIILNKVNIAHSSIVKDEKSIINQKPAEMSSYKKVNGIKSYSKTEKIDISDLIQILDNSSLNTCNKLINKLSMQKVKVFAENIIKLGTEYNISLLENWGKKLARTVISFKKNDIIEALNTFTELTEEIKELQDFKE